MKPFETESDTGLCWQRNSERFPVAVIPQLPELPSQIRKHSHFPVQIQGAVIRPRVLQPDEVHAARHPVVILVADPVLHRVRMVVGEVVRGHETPGLEESVHLPSLGPVEVAAEHHGHAAPGCAHP